MYNITSVKTTDSHQLQYNFTRSRLVQEYYHLVLHLHKFQARKMTTTMAIHFVRQVALYVSTAAFSRRLLA